MQGKAFLTAIFCCVRCILYPETKIIVAAGNKSQGIEILEKIQDMRNNSSNLSREIDELKTGANDARCTFKNGSWIRVVASNQGARSKRANVVVVDEFRMVENSTSLLVIISYKHSVNLVKAKSLDMLIPSQAYESQ